MNLSSPQLALACITSTDQAEFLRSENRNRIANLVNGFPPVDGATAKKMGLDLVYNDLSALTLFRAAYLQYYNAFQSRSIFFNIRVPSMPEERRQDWEMLLTQFINEPLKRSKKFGCLLDQKFASVVMHGIGTQFWMSPDKWCADFVALNDVRVPTDTHTSLDNLVWIARRVRYTVGELAKRVFGKYADDGWNKEAVGSILEHYWKLNTDTTNDLTYPTWPERYSQIIRQNGAYFVSDAVPTIHLWHIYHLDDSKPLRNRVMMKVIPDQSVQGKSYDKFLYDSKAPEAERWDHQLHVQFGDLNGEPPFMWHSVRSLGFMLHDSAFWKNLTTCRALQHLWENFQLLLQVDGLPDKMRAAKVEMMRGILPTGVRIVPQTERHQIDAGLLQFMLSNLKQNMGEASSAYTQDIDTGTKKERTAFETMTLLQQVNAVLGGLLSLAFRNERHHYAEVARRFCRRKSLDPDVREFWDKCKRAGISRQYLNSDLWTIEPDIPLGQGNQTLELAAATQLFGIRGALNPDAQQLSLHMYIAAVTHNPQLAQRMAPVGERKALTDGQRDAQSIFGTLMAGGMVEPREEFPPQEQVETLLTLAFDVTSRIEAAGNMATMPQIAGLSNVAAYVGELVQRMAQDEAHGELVKQYSDALGQLQNLLKGFAQRLAEQNQQQGDPEAQAKAQAIVAQTQAKIAAKEAEFAQKMQHRETQFEQKMAQMVQKAQADLAKQMADSQTELAARGMETAQKLDAQRSAAAVQSGE